LLIIDDYYISLLFKLIIAIYIIRMKRAWTQAITNLDENLTCEFHVTIKNNYSHMKKLIISLLLMSISLGMYSQIAADQQEIEKSSSLTVGFLQGGGSLFGADFETLLSKKIGLQLGAGLFGYGGGLDFHLKPSIRSSYISLQYWHQGFGTGYTQSVLGPSFVYRGERWFTAQIGLGYVLGYGPSWPGSAVKSPVILTYALGAYFPI